MSLLEGRSISMMASFGCLIALYQEAYRSATGLALVALVSIRETPSVKRQSQKSALKRSASSPALFNLKEPVSIHPLELNSQKPSSQSLAPLPLPKAPLLRRLKLSEIPQRKSLWLKSYVQSFFGFKPKVALPSDHPEIVDGVLHAGKGTNLLLDWESIFGSSRPLSLILSFEPVPQFALNRAVERANREIGSLLITFFPINTKVDSLARPLIISRGGAQFFSRDFLPSRRIQEMTLRFPAKNESVPGGVRDAILKDVANWGTFFKIALSLQEKGELRLIFSNSDAPLEAACQQGVLDCNQKYSVLEFVSADEYEEGGKTVLQRQLLYRALPLPEEWRNR